MKYGKCEICKEYFESLDKHHIVSKCFSGLNHKDNTTYICPNCHRNVHLGNIIIEGYYLTTKGKILFWRNKGESSITGNDDPKVFLIKANK